MRNRNLYSFQDYVSALNYFGIHRAILIENYIQHSITIKVDNPSEALKDFIEYNRMASLEVKIKKLKWWHKYFIGIEIIRVGEAGVTP